MSSHIYAVGQRVQFQPSRQSLPAGGQPFKIVQRLPPEGGMNLYRIKSISEPFERMAREIELSAAT